MKRLLCPKIPKPGHSVPLNETEATHAVRVLRLGPGDVVEALDGSGKSVLAKLQNRNGAVWLEYAGEGSTQEMTEIPIPKIVLEAAILKGDAMEWVVEKAVELGVHRLVPLITAHTIVQIKSKGPEAFRDRWQKIADQALKQCGRLNRLEITAPVPLDDLFVEYPSSESTLRFWTDESDRDETPPLLAALAEEKKSFNEIRLLIGPEGGWSREEREFLTREKLTRVSLGPLVLRAETAAIFSISAISGAFLASLSPRQSS